MCVKDHKFVGVLVVLLSLTLSVTSYGKGDTFVKDGPYIGLFGSFNTIGQEFENNMYTYYPEEPSVRYYVPKLDDAFGYGITGGYREGRYSLELNYDRSSHDAEAHSIKTKALFQTLTADYKIDVFSREELRPFALVGLGGAWLKVKEGSLNVTDDVTGDMTFVGVNANAGGGLAYYFNPQFSINFRAVYRFTMFLNRDKNDIHGDGGNIDGGGINLRAGVAYTF